MDTIYGTCDAYCQSIGCVCIGAWDDDLDTCGKRHQVANNICPDCLIFLLDFWIHLSKLHIIFVQITIHICPNWQIKWSGELGYYNCAHDFGSYTSDAICECNPQPNGTCPSGAFKVPLSCTRASMVPLKKRFISNFIKELHHQWVHQSTCQPCRQSQALRGRWVFF